MPGAPISPMMEAVWAHKRQQLEKAKQKSDERLETESWMVRLKRRRSEIERDAIEDFAAETGFRPDTDTAPGGAGTVYGWNPATAGWLAAPSTPGYYNQAKPGGVATDPATAGGTASAARFAIPSAAASSQGPLTQVNTLGAALASMLASIQRGMGS